MSKKKRPVQILGPDGKPYVAPPRPKADPAPVEAGTDLGGSLDLTSWATRFMLGANPYRAAVRYNHRHGPAEAPLSEAVAQQVADLTVDFAGAGGEELPTPPRDLTAYADAFASAAKKCPHENAVEHLYGREWVCDDCHRMIGREEMRKHRGGWWF